MNDFSMTKKLFNISDSPEQLIREKAIKRGQRNFREYCNLVNPDFFKPSRLYQDELCNTLQAIYEKRLINPETNLPYDILIIALPPGFGKSYTASMFAPWLFGQNIKNQVITISYGQDLAIKFAKTVRNSIMDEEIKGDASHYVPTSFFPKLKVKHGDGAMDEWALEGNYTNYLGTSFTGKLTGMRGNIIIVDDPIKNHYEAMNDAVKQSHWDFFTSTLPSRVLPGGLQIIIQTRWASDDLAGRIITDKEYGKRCYILEMKALTEDNENGISLCDDLYPTADLQMKRRSMNKELWAANFMQVPLDLKGALYPAFKTYVPDEIDKTAFERVINYTDTADEGADSLCSGSAGVIGRYAYMLDIYYTEEPMEVTEPETARRLDIHKIREALIESNNGGRGFSRNVMRHLKQLKNKRCQVTWFHQNINKKSRILVNSANVLEQVIMPEDWETRWPEFAKSVKKYQRKGKNEHDDAPDMLTGLVEFVNGDIKGRKKARVLKRSSLGL